jgi:hypothetical protein
MGNTADITKASKTLEKLEAKLTRVQSRKDAAVAKATAKAEKVYAEKVVAAQTAADKASAELQKLVTAA